jgi:hypothetical protein
MTGVFLPKTIAIQIIFAPLPTLLLLKVRKSDVGKTKFFWTAINHNLTG